RRNREEGGNAPRRRAASAASSPANALVIRAAERFELLDALQIDDRTAAMARRDRRDLRFAGMADRDHLGAVERRLACRLQQALEMRDFLVDIFAVGADQARDIDIAVEDRELITLADQSFGQEHQRRFTQIVGARLEGEAEERDLAPAAPGDQVKGALDMLLI